MTALMDQEQERLEQPEEEFDLDTHSHIRVARGELSEAERTKKSIRRQIRRGIIPRYFLAKDKSGNGLERSGTGSIRKNRGRLTLRQVGTMAYLTKGSK